MKVFVENLNLPLRVAQTVFYILGFWLPVHLKGYKVILFNIYTFISYMFLNGKYLRLTATGSDIRRTMGTYIIIQLGDLYQVWGNVTLMTGAIFLLFTNLSLSAKIINTRYRQHAIMAMVKEAHEELSAEHRPEGIIIIDRCNRETNIQLYVYYLLTYITIFGWIVSAEKNQLPMRAWYPYDTTISPAYELTYAHQFIALFISACLNVCLDNLVTSLISQCRCRFNLLSLSLRTLCDNLTTNKGILSPEAEVLLTLRLQRCVTQHQAILNQAALLQKFFSIPVLCQFSVSMVIICVTAYQLGVVFESLFWFMSMLAYMADMLMQLFIYCYHGNNLVVESGKVSEAVYECPWYMCSPAQRRCLLLIMVRAQRQATLKAGNLTELSLATFMAIVKASYTFFSVLQGVEDEKK